jgi:hypothetical protein
MAHTISSKQRLRDGIHGPRSQSSTAVNNSIRRYNNNDLSGEFNHLHQRFKQSTKNLKKLSQATNLSSIITKSMMDLKQRDTHLEVSQDRKKRMRCSSIKAVMERPKS